jgi:Zn-dependent alcohol dehydrogenase
MKYTRVIVNRKRQLELVEEDLPGPRPGEVRLKMLAAGVVA